MAHRIIIEHVKSGKMWRSDWIKSKYEASKKIEYDKYQPDESVTIPSNGTEISIPPLIINKSIITYEYKED